jgi:hypothetical protein
MKLSAKVLQKNMNLVGPIVYTPEEIAWQQTHARKRYGRKR